MADKEIYKQKLLKKISDQTEILEKIVERAKKPITKLELVILSEMTLEDMKISMEMMENSHRESGIPSEEKLRKFKLEYQGIRNVIEEKINQLNQKYGNPDYAIN